MVIGVLQVELLIPDATSLKDKRRVLASLKDRLHQQNEVAVAEVDRQDAHQIAVLGIVTVSNTARRARTVLAQVVERLRHSRRCVLNDQRTEILQGF